LWTIPEHKQAIHAGEGEVAGYADGKRLPVYFGFRTQVQGIRALALNQITDDNDLKSRSRYNNIGNISSTQYKSGAGFALSGQTAVQLDEDSVELTISGPGSVCLGDLDPDSGLNYTGELDGYTDRYMLSAGLALESPREVLIHLYHLAELLDVNPLNIAIGDQNGISYPMYRYSLESLLVPVVIGGQNPVYVYTKTGDIDLPSDTDTDNYLYQNCELFIRSNTSNGSTTFTDSSPKTRSITASNVEHSNLYRIWGSSSIYLDQLSSQLSVANDGTLNTTGDFTVRFLMKTKYIDPTNGYNLIKFGSNTILNIYGSCEIRGTLCGSSIQGVDSLGDFNDWTTVCIMRHGSILTVSLNGTCVVSLTNTSEFGDVNSDLYLGQHTTNEPSFIGWVEEFQYHQRAIPDIDGNYGSSPNYLHPGLSVLRKSNSSFGDRSGYKIKDEAFDLVRLAGATIVASGEVVGYEGSKAFDGDSGTYWDLNGTSGNIEASFIKYNLRACRYTIGSVSGQSTNAPSSWELQMYDGSSWDTLDTRSDITTWTDAEVKTFSFRRTDKIYQKAKLVISAVNGGTTCSISDIGIIDESKITKDTSYVPGTQLANPALSVLRSGEIHLSSSNMWTVEVDPDLVGVSGSLLALPSPDHQRILVDNTGRPAAPRALIRVSSLGWSDEYTLNDVDGNRVAYRFFNQSDHTTGAINTNDILFRYDLPADSMVWFDVDALTVETSFLAEDDVLLDTTTNAREWPSSSVNDKISSLSIDGTDVNLFEGNLRDPLVVPFTTEGYYASWTALSDVAAITGVGHRGQSNIQTDRYLYFGLNYGATALVSPLGLCRFDKNLRTVAVLPRLPLSYPDGYVIATGVGFSYDFEDMSGDSIFVLGGTKNDNSAVATVEALRFDISSSVWAFMNRLGTGKCGGWGCLDGNYMYMFGGLSGLSSTDKDNNARTKYDSIGRYDVTTETYESTLSSTLPSNMYLGDKTAPRNDTKAFLHGGAYNGLASDNMVAYTFSTGVVETLGSNVTGNNVYLRKSQKLGNYAYYAGGSLTNNTGSVNKVHQYDMDSNTWSLDIDTLPFNMYGFVFGYWDDKIVAFGGLKDSGTANATGSIKSTQASKPNSTYQAIENGNQLSYNALKSLSGYAEINGRDYVIVVGGDDSPTGSGTTHTNIFDVESQRWFEGSVCPISSIGAAGGTYISAIGHHIVALWQDNELYEYDADTDTWDGPITVTNGSAQSAIKDYVYKMVDIDDRPYLYMFGGKNGSDVDQDQLCVIDVLSRTLSAPAQTGTIPTGTSCGYGLLTVYTDSAGINQLAFYKTSNNNLYRLNLVTWVWATGVAVSSPHTAPISGVSYTDRSVDNKAHHFYASGAGSGVLKKLDATSGSTWSDISFLGNPPTFGDYPIMCVGYQEMGLYEIPYIIIGYGDTVDPEISKAVIQHRDATIDILFSSPAVPDRINVGFEAGDLRLDKLELEVWGHDGVSWFIIEHIPAGVVNRSALAYTLDNTTSMTQMRLVFRYGVGVSSRALTVSNLQIMENSRDAYAHNKRVSLLRDNIEVVSPALDTDAHGRKSLNSSFGVYGASLSAAQNYVAKEIHRTGIQYKTAVSPSYPYSAQYSTTDYNRITLSGITTITGSKVLSDGDVKFVFSFDDRVTWQKYSGGTWSVTDISTVALFRTNGMTQAEVDAIPSAAWSAIDTTVDMSVLLTLNTSSDNPWFGTFMLTTSDSIESTRIMSPYNNWLSTIIYGDSDIKLRDRTDIEGSVPATTLNSFSRAIGHSPRSLALDASRSLDMTDVWTRDQVECMWAVATENQNLPLYLSMSMIGSFIRGNDYLMHLDYGVDTVVFMEGSWSATQSVDVHRRSWSSAGTIQMTYGKANDQANTHLESIDAPTGTLTKYLTNHWGIIPGDGAVLADQNNAWLTGGNCAATELWYSTLIKVDYSTQNRFNQIRSEVPSLARKGAGGVSDWTNGYILASNSPVNTYITYKLDYSTDSGGFQAGSSLTGGSNFTGGGRSVGASSPTLNEGYFFLSWALINSPTIHRVAKIRYSDDTIQENIRSDATLLGGTAFDRNPTARTSGINFIYFFTGGMNQVGMLALDLATDTMSRIPRSCGPVQDGSRADGSQASGITF